MITTQRQLMWGSAAVIGYLLLMAYGATAYAQQENAGQRDQQTRESLAKLPDKFSQGVGIQRSDTPMAEHRRAARLLEDARGQAVAPDWKEARLGNRVRRFYRPDINGVAYLEYEVEPQGFVTVAVGRHDQPVATWNSEGEAPGAALERIAAERGERAVKLYKLDTLSYAAENARGELVATLGSPMLKVSGLDPRALDTQPQLSQVSVAPEQPVANDAEAQSVKHKVIRSGPGPSGLKLERWGSWDELKNNYGRAYGTLAEAARRRAATDWKIDDDIEQWGEGLVEGQSISVPLLESDARVEVTGPGADAASVKRREHDRMPPAIRLESKAARAERAPLVVKIRYRDGKVETRKFFVEKAGAGQAKGVKRRSDWSPWTIYHAGSSTDQRDYNQFTYKGCASGCGPTAWAMLFGWGDYRASLGDSKWRSRWGLYRRDGGRGENAVAPKAMDDGIRNISKEINGQVKTFCAGSSGATPPWDMPNASNYLSGRTGTTLVAHWNSLGIAESRLLNYAKDSIRLHKTPVIIGTGWLTHYPLAWKYAWRKRTTWSGLSTEYQRMFYVNQGWGGSGNAWVPADTWFAGEIRP